MLTIFYQSKLSLPLLVRIFFHFFIIQYSVEETSQQTGVNEKTVRKLFQDGREIISEFIEDEWRNNALGWINKPGTHYPNVEIYESMFGHANGEQRWVLGIYDNGMKEVRIKVVTDRSAQTLMPMIWKMLEDGNGNLHPQLRVCTDGWRAYSDQNLGFAANGVVHIVFNHSEQHWGWSNRRFCTSQIEGVWSHLKELGGFKKGIAGNMSEELTQIRINWAVFLRTYKHENERLAAFITAFCSYQLKKKYNR